MSNIAKTEIDELEGQLVTNIHPTWAAAKQADDSQAEGWTMDKELEEGGNIIREWRNNRGYLAIVVIGESEEAIEKVAMARFMKYVGD